MTDLTLEQWDEVYRPIQNHLDPFASLGGTMFETFGEEYAYVLSEDEHYVWTYVDGDNGELLLLSGFHIINRIGYFITEKMWETPTTVIIED